jgi:hypothetical protein
MIVMPVFRFPHLQRPLDDMSWFLYHVIQRLEPMTPKISFCAGISFGKVFLDEIRTESFHEWSVYGNCVSGAKRLQSVAPTVLGADSLSPRYRALIGAVDSENPNFLQEFKRWLGPLVDPRYLPPLEFVHARTDCEELRGVGRMCFHEVSLRTINAERTNSPRWITVERHVG